MQICNNENYAKSKRKWTRNEGNSLELAIIICYCVHILLCNDEFLSIFQFLSFISVAFLRLIFTRIEYYCENK